MRSSTTASDDRDVAATGETPAPALGPGAAVVGAGDAAATLPHPVTTNPLDSFSAPMVYADHSPSGTRLSLATTAATDNLAPRAAGFSANALTACASTSRSVSSSTSSGMAPSIPVISLVMAVAPS